MYHNKFTGAITLLLVSIFIHACISNDCPRTYLNKYTLQGGYSYESDSIKVNLKNITGDLLTVYAVKTNNKSFNLIYSSASDNVHFHPGHNKNKADSVLIVYYGSGARDTIKRQAYFFEHKGKFMESETFVIEPAIANEMISNEGNHAINFTLGNYKFDMSNEMMCVIKQMIKNEL